MTEPTTEQAPGKASAAPQGKAVFLATPQPWPEPVNGASLLNDMLDAFRRYLVLPPGGAVTMALWVMHAHVFDFFSVTPFLVFRSPVKQTGKTRAMTIIRGLVPRPLMSSSVTAAGVFRTVERHRPTLLIDEFDAVYRNDETFRAVLNSGHTRSGAYVIRMAGDDHQARIFSTWAPKVIAGIGRLPETLEDRAIVINMRRRAADETIERLRLDRLDEFESLCRKAARWAADNGESLRDADPAIPAGLSDRAADNWLPLLAVADRCGGCWGADARHAATTLAGARQETGDNDKLEILQDMKTVFEEEGNEVVPCDVAVKALVEMEGRPWSDYRRGRAITSYQVGRLLGQFDIKSRQEWADGKNRRCYTADAFTDAWRRYLTDAKQESNSILLGVNH